MSIKIPLDEILASALVDDTEWHAVRGTIGEVTYERVIKFNRDLSEMELGLATAWVRMEKCWGSIDPMHWPNVKVTCAAEKTAAWLFEITIDTSGQA